MLCGPSTGMCSVQRFLFSVLVPSAMPCGGRVRLTNNGALREEGSRFTTVNGAAAVRNTDFSSCYAYPASQGHPLAAARTAGGLTGTERAGRARATQARLTRKCPVLLLDDDVNGDYPTGAEFVSLSLERHRRG